MAAQGARSGGGVAIALSCLALAALAALTAGAPAVAGEAAAVPEQWELRSYWHDGRIDTFETATTMGQNAALNVFGYRFVRAECRVFAAQQPGTIPLQLWWSEALQDNATVASTDAIATVKAAGYENKATEGYVYADERPGTVALKLYYSAKLNDYLTTTAATGAADALAKGYRFVRIEGYALPLATADR